MAKIENIQVGDVKGVITIPLGGTLNIYRINALYGLYENADDVYDKYALISHPETNALKLRPSGDTSTNHYFQPVGINGKPGIQCVNGSTIRKYTLPKCRNESYVVPKTGRKLKIVYSYCDTGYDGIIVYYVDGTNSGNIYLNGSGERTFENVSYFRIIGGSTSPWALSFNASDYYNSSMVTPLVARREYITYSSQYYVSGANLEKASYYFVYTANKSSDTNITWLPYLTSNYDTFKQVKFFLLRDTQIYYPGYND